MLKNKLFLNGLGTGLIIGAILLQLMFSVTEAQNKQLPESEDAGTDTEAAVVQRAKELGYQVFKKDEKIFTDEQLQEQLQEVKDKAGKQAAESATASAEQMRAFTVAPSTSSGTVSDMLLEMKLIKDKQAFENELTKRQLNSKIQAGYYIFPGNPTVNDIILKITKP